MLDGTEHTEREMAEVAARSRRDARGNPHAVVTGEGDVDSLLKEPFVVSPLRHHDCAPIADGAAAVVLAADDLAREVSDRPAWIRGIDHRIEPHSLGARDLTRSASTRIAGERAQRGRPHLLGRGLDRIHAPTASRSGRRRRHQGPYRRSERWALAAG